MQEQSLSEARRKQIFLALVQVQDQGVRVAQSRKIIARRFGVSEDQIRQTEEQGLESEWPPLVIQGRGGLGPMHFTPTTTGSWRST